MPEKVTFPPMIEDLPDIDLPVEGVRGKLLQGVDQQVVFFDIQAVGVIPEHSHGAQWGIILEGEVELTIDGRPNVYKKGESYYIPAGVTHSARSTVPFKALDVFDDVDRYPPK
ncbi:MAG: cupin domain-containing protein [Proteobacteria bacterium]|nr:cupin domain-containing protein [Pseudomonadota bacterium]MBU1740518.1 cupin domain-containing protein [Pseudomonadota bacterium]